MNKLIFVALAIVLLSSCTIKLGAGQASLNQIEMKPIQVKDIQLELPVTFQQKSLYHGIQSLKETEFSTDWLEQLRKMDNYGCKVSILQDSVYENNLIICHQNVPHKRLTEKNRATAWKTLEQYARVTILGDRPTPEIDERKIIRRHAFDCLKLKYQKAAKDSGQLTFYYIAGFNKSYVLGIHHQQEEDFERYVRQLKLT